MSSCEGCFTSAKGQSIQLDVIRSQAKSYAIETEKTMAIYKEGYEYFYSEASAATTAGKNIMEFISESY